MLVRCEFLHGFPVPGAGEDEFGAPWQLH
jgi:hypothetical protein